MQTGQSFDLIKSCAYYPDIQVIRCSWSVGSECLLRGRFVRTCVYPPERQNQPVLTLTRGSSARHGSVGCIRIEMRVGCGRTEVENLSHFSSSGQFFFNPVSVLVPRPNHLHRWALRFCARFDITRGGSSMRCRMLRMLPGA